MTAPEADSASLGGAAQVRVLIVDDQQLVRRGLAMLLGTAPGIEIVAQAAGGDEALALLARESVDVLVTDARMPGIDGIELTRRARADRAARAGGADLPVLVLTTFDDEDLVRGALAAGASGFLLKDTSTEALADAIRAVLAGGMVIDPRVARFAFAASSSASGRTGAASGADPVRSEAPDALAVLTPTERSVGELVAEGRTNAEIAAALHLAEGTVKNHVSALLRKLGQRDRTALALTLYRALRG